MVIGERKYVECRATFWKSGFLLPMISFAVLLKRFLAVPVLLQEFNKLIDAVVKVYCVHTEPNFSLPWQRKRQYASTSSGFMVAGPAGEKWLLTNAHSVDYFSQVGYRSCI